MYHKKPNNPNTDNNNAPHEKKCEEGSQKSTDSQSPVAIATLNMELKKSFRRRALELDRKGITRNMGKVFEFGIAIAKKTKEKHQKEVRYRTQKSKLTRNNNSNTLSNNPTTSSRGRNDFQPRNENRTREGLH
ncbi:hypothetical protein MLD38_036412 [Melastoma candidum]|uniref:Uncharacterized protein n=1 Tax=Melastoma candidum TaxID=119954 RepID=A0ACB9LJT8_9MYRT|nr:hypothetical protein MLD38_036412 [Melastoma candidum]